MKKQTKLLLGAGAALGVGYLLLRKKDDGSMGALGAAGPFTPEELAEFNEFDSFYLTDLGLRDDYGDVLAAIAARRGVRLTESQQDAAYAAAVAAGMDSAGCGTAADRCATDAEILSYYGPFILQSLADLGAGGSTGGESSGGECPAGTVATGQNPDGSIVCASTDIGPGTADPTVATKCGGKYHTRSAGETCGAHCECVGTLLCLSGKCGEKTSGGSGAGGAITPADKDALEQKPPKKDDGGIGIGTIALALAAGGVVYFLLKTDDTKVTRLREVGAEKAREYGSRAAGAASKKLAEYQRRLANGSGVNGLRRRRKTRR